MTSEEAAVISAGLSAVAALITCVIAWLQVRVADATRDQSASVAMMDRLSQINQLKVMFPDLWECLEKETIEENENLHTNNKTGLGHLIFATFKMYEEAFLMKNQGRLSERDYKLWENRFRADLQRHKRYRIWWREEIECGFANAWDCSFKKLVHKLCENVIKYD